jgi:hypothetical protein
MWRGEEIDRTMMLQLAGWRCLPAVDACHCWNEHPRKKKAGFIDDALPGGWQSSSACWMSVNFSR